MPESELTTNARAVADKCAAAESLCGNPNYVGGLASADADTIAALVQACTDASAPAEIVDGATAAHVALSNAVELGGNMQAVVGFAATVPGQITAACDFLAAGNGAGAERSAHRHGRHKNHEA